jgi:hypothetical protein
MPPLINAPPRQRRAQLLGATAHGEAGELAPQRLHFRRSDETKEAAERGRVSFLEMHGPLDAQKRHQHERQQRRAQAIEGWPDVTVRLIQNNPLSTTHARANSTPTPGSANPS